MKEKTIGVLGCGWLGLPLALQLKENGYLIKGTVSSVEKKEQLLPVLDSLCYLKVEEDKLYGEISFFDALDVLVVAIPPQLRGNSKANFVKKIALILQYVKQYKVKHIVYIGTTAVFPNDNATYFEDSLLVPFDAKSTQLIQVEKQIQQASKSNTIIRLGGLVGEDRHPVTTLAKMESVKNPLAPINLIHQKDAIGMICHIIDQQQWGGVFHGVCLNKQTKETYYKSEASKRDLKLRFDMSQPSVGKKIDATKSMEILKYVFINEKL